ncbi:MAG: GNAT family N-acetyltransferase [Actinobacteria bacterium]|nr:GNAT family N-acetyltransferase [Actinomycetota bacterium]
MLRVEAPIETERLRLRPFQLGDLDGLAEIQSRPEVARYLYWEPRRREEVEKALAQLIAATRIEGKDQSVSLAVEPRAGGGLLGYVSIWLRSLDHRQVEIGFVFHPDAQGRGYASEAARELLVLAFERLRAHRVFGRTDARNASSVALMRRLGMRQEAHFREAEVFKGEWGDELVFAILEDEWGGALVPDVGD